VEAGVAPSVVRFESSIVIAAPADEVFERLADLPSYAGWMHHDGLFRRCVPTTEGPVRVGTAYADMTRMGTFHGEVVEYTAPTRLAFRETLRWFGRPVSEARAEYTLEADGASTAVHHVAVGELFGVMRPMKPGAAWMANRERSRTLQSLQRSLEDRQRS
jgi:uncharacterized protein YndB with AHSA1/START domain